MKSPDEKPNPDRDAVETKPPRQTEARQIIEEYVNDLREIITKLRGRLN
jgi:hypothetical protein